jgi:hypothetical protein
MCGHPLDVVCGENPIRDSAWIEQRVAGAAATLELEQQHGHEGVESDSKAPLRVAVVGSEAHDHDVQAGRVCRVEDVAQLEAQGAAQHSEGQGQTRAGLQHSTTHDGKGITLCL